MFRTDEQISRVNRALLKRLGLERLWDMDGPSRDASQYLGKGILSHGEDLILKVCWDLWNGNGKANIGDLVGVLDRDNLHAVGALLMAISDDEQAIDQWINEEEALAFDTERCADEVTEES